MAFYEDLMLTTYEVTWVLAGKGLKHSSDGPVYCHEFRANVG